ncbi:apolipoprotein L3-like [Toxotes jaculatrix]|uniref:apolipoprotein L3-like n=1 Tax=Toxotes jaculatrix TaxID=941984 RepID=UPI001B3AA635|nr:apolipoprotein L3-like [Toxotes jaculatrix]
MPKPPVPTPRKQSIPQGQTEVTGEQSVKNKCKAKPPQLPPKPPKKKAGGENKTEDDCSVMDWWQEKIPWSSLGECLQFAGEKESRIIKIKARELEKAVQVYIYLLSKDGGTLKEYIVELLSIADNLDKFSKGTKIAGITGGASTVAGGVAAAAGVILSPFTLGASLALTAVGVGVAAAGGVTGASAAIANKVNVTQDKKKIEKICKEYKDIMVEVKDCLKYINEGMGSLKKHDLSVLSEARKSSVRTAKMIDLAAKGGVDSKAMEASKASGLIEGFSLGMDFYFTNGKDGQKLKKGLESKFALNIRKLAEELSGGLDELMQIKELFSEHCPEC